MPVYKKVELIDYANGNEIEHKTLSLSDVDYQEGNGTVEMSLSLSDRKDEKDDICIGYEIDKHEAEFIVLFLKQQFKL